MKKLGLLLMALVLSVSIVAFAGCKGSTEDSSTEETSISFSTVYYSCGCSSPWADYGVDYLNIDSNPYNYDSDSSLSTKYLVVAAEAIQKINRELGLPTYLYDDMIKTTALEGRQSYSGTKVNVSWKYHPNNGLEVRYTAK